jgi:hypothetical protein
MALADAGGKIPGFRARSRRRIFGALGRPPFGIGPFAYKPAEVIGGIATLLCGVDQRQRLLLLEPDHEREARWTAGNKVRRSLPVSVRRRMLGFPTNSQERCKTERMNCGPLSPHTSSACAVL